MTPNFISSSDALSTLNEIRVLHSKVIKGLTSRTNTIIRQQARRKAIRRKTLTPSTSTASLDFSVEVKHKETSSTPASKVGNQSGTTYSDTTLVSTELAMADNSVLNVQNSTVLQKTWVTNLNVSSSPSPLPKVSANLLTSEEAPASTQKIRDMIDAGIQPKESVVLKPIHSVHDIVLKAEPLVSEVAVHPALSPSFVQLPQSPKDCAKSDPYSRSVLCVNFPMDRSSSQCCSPSLSGALNIKEMNIKENIPPPPVTYPGINARGSPRAKKSVRYRDKLPKSLLCNDNGSIREISEDGSARNVVNNLHSANVAAQYAVMNSSTWMDPHTNHSNVPDCSRASNASDPLIPGGWTGHNGSLNQTSCVQSTFPRLKTEASYLERQDPAQSVEAVETSLFSTLDSVSYLMDLVVFPLKLVWRMTYGG